VSASQGKTDSQTASRTSRVRIMLLRTAILRQLARKDNPSPGYARARRGR
jgi:hypothetical protein